MAQPEGGHIVRRDMGLQRQCQSLLDRLAVPEQFDLDQLCAWAATLRGRPLHVRAMPEADASPSGMWIATDVEDLVLVEQNTSALHRRHIVFHEIGHMFATHRGAVGSSDPGHALQLLNVPVARHILARSSAADRQEQEAEMLATLLSFRAASSPVAATSGRSGPTVTGGRRSRRPSRWITRWWDTVSELIGTSLALHRLWPLWRSLRTADPSATDLPLGWRTTLTPAGRRLRLMRRVIEIRDAQLALRAYADALVDRPPGEPTATVGSRQGADDVDEAVWLARAHRARLSGAEPTVPYRPLTVTGRDELGDEVTALLALGAAWSGRPDPIHDRGLRSARVGGRR